MIDGLSTLTAALWVMGGAFIGGVVTPILAEKKRANTWLLTLIGLVVGGVGSLVLLIPFWLAIKAALPDTSDTRPSWRRDALTQDEVQRVLTAPAAPIGPEELLGLLRDNFWPKARPAGEHSHRMTYVGVAAVLAVITAVEVLLSVVGDPGFNIVGPLVALSTAKVMLVVLYFMHLRYDSRWYAWVFAAATPFAALVLVVLALS